jgi:hypothetical protein
MFLIIFVISARVIFVYIFMTSNEQSFMFSLMFMSFRLWMKLVEFMMWYIYGSCIVSFNTVAINFDNL